MDTTFYEDQFISVPYVRVRANLSSLQQKLDVVVII